MVALNVNAALCNVQVISLSGCLNGLTTAMEEPGSSMPYYSAVACLHEIEGSLICRRGCSPSLRPYSNQQKEAL